MKVPLRDGVLDSCTARFRHMETPWASYSRGASRTLDIQNYLLM